MASHRRTQSLEIRRSRAPMPEDRRVALLREVLKQRGVRGGAVNSRNRPTTAKIGLVRAPAAHTSSPSPRPDGDASSCHCQNGRTRMSHTQTAGNYCCGKPWRIDRFPEILVAVPAGFSVAIDGRLIKALPAWRPPRSSEPVRGLLKGSWPWGWVSSPLSPARAS